MAISSHCLVNQLMESSAIGVVIPTHRFDDWLNEAVISTLASEGVSVRVVVVVNGLDDLSEASWISDERVTLLHFAEPLGPSGAMLPGLACLDTEFIARLDADDRMLPQRLKTQAQYLHEHPETHLVATRVRRITETGTPAGSIKMPAGADVRRHLILANRLVHSSFMMRREAMIQAGGYKAEHEQMEDYDLALRLARLGPIAVLPEELTEYRLHEAQVSRGARPRGEHITRILHLRRQLGKELGMSRASIGARNLLWRTVQFTRYYGITKPGHEL